MKRFTEQELVEMAKDLRDGGAVIDLFDELSEYNQECVLSAMLSQIYDDNPTRYNYIIEKARLLSTALR